MLSYRVAAIINALGHATIYEYAPRGNKTYEGGATCPVRYTYDVYGNKVRMTTYRDEEGMRSVASVVDTTTLFYDEASGETTFAYDAFGTNTNETVNGVAGTNMIERFTDVFGSNAILLRSGLVRNRRLRCCDVAGKSDIIVAVSWFN